MSLSTSAVFLKILMPYLQLAAVEYARLHITPAIQPAAVMIRPPATSQHAGHGRGWG